MDSTTKLIVFLQEMKKRITELKNMTQDIPQCTSYSINSKTSFIVDKIKNLDEYINDIMLDLM